MKFLEQTICEKNMLTSYFVNPQDRKKIILLKLISLTSKYTNYIILLLLDCNTFF